MVELNSGVDESVAETQEFQQIPEDQLIDASQALQTTDSNESILQESSKSENFKALRGEVQEKQRKIEELERRIEEDRRYFDSKFSSLSQPQQSNKSEIFSSDKSDILSAGEIEVGLSKFSKDIKSQLDELKMMQRYPDYNSVIQENLVPLLKEKPYLYQVIQNSDDRAQVAYDLAKMASSNRSNTEMSGPERAQKIVENSRKPIPSSTYGGTSSISKATVYEQMSDKEFMEFAQRNLDSI